MWPRTVDKSDLKIAYYKGSGPGGQNKNKRDTACRITHIPTVKDHRTNKVYNFDDVLNGKLEDIHNDLCG